MRRVLQHVGWDATSEAGEEGIVLCGRGLHSFTLEFNLSNSRTQPCVELGYTYTVDRRAQVELKSERV